VEKRSFPKTGPPVSPAILFNSRGEMQFLQDRSSGQPPVTTIMGHS
jgi:hypothetical protein